MADFFPPASGGSAGLPPYGREPRPDTSVPGAGVLLFNRYRVVRELGRGGMGVVVLAEDTVLGIRVAVKLVPDLVVKDTEAIADVRKEVLRGMALAHPGIVRTHTFEKNESEAGIVMEYVEGSNLGELKGRQPGGCFDPVQILPWVEQICAVLDYAHQDARIVHRDLKPRNIMLTQSGRVKVADFGIAAMLNDSMSKHSMEGIVSGTLSYMSPQQAEGKRPTRLDDIHALGATLYELLTGKPPFFRGNPASIHAQILTMVPPSVGERRSELGVRGRSALPPVWEETIASCLAKEPAERPPSAGEVFVRLKAAFYTAPAPTPPKQEGRAEPPEQRQFSLPPPSSPAKPPPLSSVPWLIGIVVVLVAALAAAGLGSYLARKGVEPTTEAQSSASKGTPLGQVNPATRVERTPSTVQIHATREAPYVNSLGMQFVPTWEDDVLMSIWETRVGDFAAFVEATNYQATVGIWVLKVITDSSTGNYRTKWTLDPAATWRSPGFSQTDTHPVVGVNLTAAKSFCAWLTRREREAGRIPADACYALPTDDEWSAAVGPTTYPWGEAWPPLRGAGNYFDRTAVTDFPGENWSVVPDLDDGAACTAPVGSYDPNLYGIFDLGGNVMEWSQSLYRSSRNPADVLKKAPSYAKNFNDDGSPYYDLCGATWATSDKVFLQSKTRGSAVYGAAQADLGFRVVLLLAPHQADDFCRRAWGAEYEQRPADALADYNAALALVPSDYQALEARARLRKAAGDFVGQLIDYEALYRHHREFPQCANSLAWLLATCPMSSIRNGARAVQIASEACTDTQHQSALLVDTLAAAYAEAGEWAKAVETQQRARELLVNPTTERTADYTSRLDLYRQRTPYREVSKN